jgi:hypothetical protein
MGEPGPSGMEAAAASLANAMSMSIANQAPRTPLMRLKGLSLLATPLYVITVTETLQTAGSFLNNKKTCCHSGTLTHVQGLLLHRSSKADVLPLPLELSLLVASKLGFMMLEYGILLVGEPLLQHTAVLLQS